jgi:hypothetical protein
VRVFDFEMLIGKTEAVATTGKMRIATLELLRTEPTLELFGPVSRELWCTAKAARNGRVRFLGCAGVRRLTILSGREAVRAN